MLEQSRSCCASLETHRDLEVPLSVSCRSSSYCEIVLPMLDYGAFLLDTGGK